MAGLTYLILIHLTQKTNTFTVKNVSLLSPGNFTEDAIRAESSIVNVSKDFVVWVGGEER